MSQELYSAEQIADLLNLHVRTVRNYVREGRLKAVRIGKQYRIAREDFEAMTGSAGAWRKQELVRRQRWVEVSSIVEIDAIGPEAANRISNGLVGAAKDPNREDQPLRVEAIYNQERGRLKVILTGSIATVVSFLRFLTVYLDE